MTGCSICYVCYLRTGGSYG